MSRNDASETIALLMVLTLAVVAFACWLALPLVQQVP